jgi:hypothetical protein
MAESSSGDASEIQHNPSINQNQAALGQIGGFTTMTVCAGAIDW